MEKLIKAIVKGLTFTTPEGTEVSIDELANLSAADIRSMGIAVNQAIKQYTGEGDPDFGTTDKKVPQALIVKRDVLKGFLAYKEEDAKKAEKNRTAKAELEIVKEAEKEMKLAKLRGLSEKENKAKQDELNAIIASTSDDDDDWEE